MGRQLARRGSWPLRRPGRWAIEEGASATREAQGPGHHPGGPRAGDVPRGALVGMFGRPWGVCGQWDRLASWEGAPSGGGVTPVRPPRGKVGNLGGHLGGMVGGWWRRRGAPGGSYRGDGGAGEVTLVGRLASWYGVANPPDTRYIYFDVQW